MAESSERNNKQDSEIKELRSEFNHFVRNDHTHLLIKVAELKSGISTLEGQFKNLKETAEKALDLAIHRHPAWVAFVLSSLMSLVTGLAVWTLTH